MTVLYNEIDRHATQWLRNLIAAGYLPQGEIDESPIQSIKAAGLARVRQFHAFAGIGGWPLALTLAGWPENEEVFTGSCPCQPFSLAGKGQGEADPRHLWPEFFRLIKERHPTTIFGEQVAAATKQGWIDSVFDDLETQGYACGQAVLPSCGVGALDVRRRIYWVADSKSQSRFQANQKNVSSRERESKRQDSWSEHSRFCWREMAKPSWTIPASWIIREINGLPGRVGGSIAYGNAINPILGAEFVMAYMETRGLRKSCP